MSISCLLPNFWCIVDCRLARFQNFIRSEAVFQAVLKAIFDLCLDGEAMLKIIGKLPIVKP